MPALLGEPPLALDGRQGTAGSHGASAPTSYCPGPSRKVAPAAPQPGGAPKPRPGGRRPEEGRRCKMRTGLVANAAGSAFMEQGRTKVIATVYGPRELPRETAQGVLTLDVQFAPFSFRGLKPYDNEKRAVLYTSLLRGALGSVVQLEKYGTSALDVSVLVLEDHGCVLTAALGAASLALADAGIETSDIAAGATVHLAKAAGGGAPTLLLDCDGEEERGLAADSAALHAGLCPEQGRLCLLHSAGPLPPEAFEQMVLVAKDAAEALGQEMRRCLSSHSERRAAKRQRLESALAAGADGVGAEASDDEVL